MKRRRNGLTKKDRRRFVRHASTLIEQHGGQPTRPEYENGITEAIRTEYLMDSKYGPLQMSVTERTSDTGGPGDVMTRFEFAGLATPVTGCNQYSGKWNHHYFSPWTAQNALEDVQRWLKQIQPTSLESFSDETSLLPSVIAQTVIAARCHRGSELCDPAYAFANGGGMNHDESASWFTTHVERRTIFLWDVNPGIAKILASDGNSGRDILYAFVEHWLDAYQDNPPKYRKKRPLLSLE